MAPGNSGREMAAVLAEADPRGRCPPERHAALREHATTSARPELVTVWEWDYATSMRDSG